jgi:hypothetical protein
LVVVVTLVVVTLVVFIVVIRSRGARCCQISESGGRSYNASLYEITARPRDPRARLFEICHFCPRALTDIDTC